MPSIIVKRKAEARLPTLYGEFKILIYTEEDTKQEHTVLATISAPGTPALVRVHSQCLTGDTLLSRKCDCRQQLHQSMQLISAAGGYLLYLNQEGRGIGLANKIRAYALQETGLDTVAANVALGLPADARDYAVAAAILFDLGVREVELITNNPQKTRGLMAAGITVAAERRLIIEQTNFNADYLAAKQEKLGHHVVN